MATQIPQASNQSNGFRLQRLEVYNWGTFNHQVWPVEMNGHTALLTGANGSGKSTLVDALLTLLVPNQKRSYNQASGAEKRKERDERSYVRGAYGRIKDEENNRGVVQYLRARGEYAVLLACFANGRQAVSLAHVFYWRGDELQKMYIVAPRALAIAEDLRITSTPDELRKRLRASGAEVFDEFVRYSRRVIKEFGLRSDKALDLFNQTVSIKEIGGLNDFVRNHMLERTDASEKIAQLRETYKNLTDAHDAIVKAEAQLARLVPLLADADLYATQQERIAEAVRCTELVPPYVARRKLAMLERETNTARDKITELGSNANALDTSMETLRQHQIDLRIAINNDDKGQQIEKLKQEIKRSTEQQREKKGRADKYNDTARKLGVPTSSDSETFFATAKQARAALAPIEKHMTDLVQKRDIHKQDEGRLRAVCQELQHEIASLRGRTSGIPSEDLRLREKLATALDIAEHELPFAGELLKVRDDERRWQGAIERLLRGYGRQMLVPETHYQQVRGYVDATDLRGRLVYHRVNLRRVARTGSHNNDTLVLHKLEVKPNSDFHDWLKADVLEHWDMVCCETLEQFGRERRALTVNGQIKRGDAQHEKDDRFRLDDRTKYVLGWDNREKVAALERDLHDRRAELQHILDAISALEKEQKQRNEQRRLIDDLLRYDNFSALDWQTEARRIDELTEQQRALEASSDRLAQLQAQLQEVEAQIKTVDADIRQAQTRITTQENAIARYETQHTESTQKLHAVLPEVLDAHAALLDVELKKHTLNLETIDGVEHKVERFFTDRAISFRGNASSTAVKIAKHISDFKHEYPNDTLDIDESIEAVGEFRRMHERLTNDDLPTYRKRFQAWMKDKVGEAITGFQSSLTTSMDDYRGIIHALNGALRTINYTPATYIELTTNQNKDAEIQEFRSALRACIPDVGQRTPEANEAKFQHIRALINRFEKEERWTNKVTDVRFWLDFAAEEHYNEDHSIKDYYSDSSGKSGGQKAKLAYTILASAIAYQYGLTQHERQQRTFRFVVVDEAFSKSDETNARYAMDLFRQLNLQLLVVTPLDKTHVVEPYIEACHFVTNSVEENNSRIYNLSMEQYREQKDQFGAA